MTNTELKTTIQNILNNKVREDARIEYTQHGNGYCVCIRVPHNIERSVKVNGVQTIRKSIGWSLPVTFWAWGIQSKHAIDHTINEVLRFHNHLKGGSHAA